MEITYTINCKNCGKAFYSKDPNILGNLLCSVCENKICTPRSTCGSCDPLYIKNFIKQSKQPEIEYLIGSGYNEAFVYEINHKNKMLQTHKFKHLLEIRDYILFNNIKSVIFQGLGDLAPLKYDLDNHWVECSIDREIYKWRMQNLSPHERNRTTPLYYYEMQGYRYE